LGITRNAKYIPAVLHLYFRFGKPPVYSSSVVGLDIRQFVENIPDSRAVKGFGGQS
jgi:hypothetical protein